MNLAIRPASRSEREELIAVLERNFPDRPMRSRFKQQHEDNPAGAAWCWVICDRESGAICAMASLLPRPMYVDGKLVMCGQVAQFAVDNGYRSLGPAVLLQRATFGPVDSGELAFCYDCPPDDKGMSTFIRLGMRPSCEIIRYALPLRSDQILGKRFGNSPWTKPLIAGANLLLNMRRFNRRAPGLEIRGLEGRFGDEFTYLDKIVPSAGIVRSSRSAELLNWRYCDRLDSKVDVLIACQGGELLAFLAFEISAERRAAILDLFGRNLDVAGLPLLGAAIEACRRQNVVCLEGYCSDASELKALLQAAGFRARERAARVVVYAKPGEPAGMLSSKMTWPLGHAELGA